MKLIKKKCITRKRANLGPSLQFQVPVYSCGASSLFTNIILSKFSLETLPTHLYSERAASRKSVSTACPPVPSVHTGELG